MTAISKVTRSYQVTIPAEIRRQVGIKQGMLIGFELTEEGILLKPHKIIPVDQEWFWTEEWQAGEREADEDIQTGRVSEPMTVQEMRDHFDSQEEPPQDS